MATSKKSSNSGSTKNKSGSGSGTSNAQVDVGASATEAVEQVQDTVAGLGDQVKQQASNQLSSRLETAANGIDMAVKLLRTAGDQVRDQNKSGVADSVVGVADRLEGWSASLREQDVDKLMQEAREVAQRQPALFMSGAVALGFLGARLLKSPSKQQDQSSGSSSEETSASESSGNYTSGTSAALTSPAPVETDFENTNPYASSEENAALEASIEAPITYDEMVVVDDTILEADVLLDESSVDDSLLDTPGTLTRPEDR